jgi:hypothetical protein
MVLKVEDLMHVEEVVEVVDGSEIVTTGQRRL